MELSFLGATGTVTGSRYLMKSAGRSLLVDCGMFQGLKALRLRNWQPFPVQPRTIEAVVLTHAHLDTAATCRCS
jgi:metallo-beta-lactamase family protein